MADWRGPARRAAAHRRALAIAVAATAAAIVVVVVLASGSGDDSDDPAADRPEPATTIATGPIAGMSAQELVDQVLLVGFDGVDPTTPFLEQVRIHQFGGVLVDSRNWTDAATGGALVSALRAAAREGDRIPPLVTVPQEGGPYRALADLPPEQTELELGDVGSAEETEAWARDAGAALRSTGFDLDLFPVADVATLDSPLGDRAFSDDPETVAELTAAALRGCREAEIACAPGHFPGLGASSQDTDRGPGTVSLDEASLAARDLLPFQAAFAERAPAVVLSLAFYAAYDPVTPGALTGLVATSLLRDELGFEGVAITDDLGAGAVRSSYKAGEAAVAALTAGADLVQIGAPEEFDRARAALLDALSSGELTNKRLEQAARRVLTLKRNLGLLGPP